MKNKLICVISLIIALATCFSACTAPQSKEAVSMYDLSRAMLGASDRLAEMSYVSSSDSNAEDALAHIVEADYGEIDSFFVTYATSGVESCDEIVVIAVKDKAYVTKVEQMLKDHLDYRISLYRTYGAEMVPKLRETEIFVYDRYAVFIAADDTANIKKAFENFVKA